MKLDLADRYLETQSFYRDFAIIARTAKVVLRGSRGGLRSDESRLSLSQPRD